MADQFKAVFGDQLVFAPLSECREPMRDCYPSPEQLKYRVIIKHKKLQGNSDSIDSSHKVLSAYRVSILVESC